MSALRFNAAKPSEAIRALLERVEQELAPAAPAAAVSWPAAMSKEEANKKFAHALFLIKDGSFRFAHSPASRGGEQVDLVLNRRGSSTHHSYTKAATFDDEVQGVIYGALAPDTFTVASQPALVAIAPQHPDADVSHLSIRVGRLEPFIQTVSDVISNGVLTARDGTPAAWQPWTPRSAAAPPPAPPTASPTISTRDMRSAAAPLVTFLVALGITPTGSKFSATAIAQLLAAAGDSEVSTAALALLLAGPDGAPWLGAAAEVFRSITESAGEDLAAAVEQAIDAGRAMHPSIPTPRPAFVGTALRSALLTIEAAQPAQPAQPGPSGGPLVGGSDSGGSTDDETTSPAAKRGRGAALAPAPPAQPRHTSPAALPVNPQRAALQALRSGSIGGATAPAPPGWSDAKQLLVAQWLPAAAASMELSAALTTACGGSSGPMRAALAEANRGRTLDDAFLTPAQQADAALDDFLAVEGAIESRAPGSWRRPPAPADWAGTPGIVGALRRAWHAAKDLEPARRGPSGESPPLAEASATAALEGYTAAVDTFGKPPLPPYGSHNKLGKVAADAAPLAPPVFAPLATLDAISRVHAAPPLPSQPAEAAQLCAMLGQPAIAFHVSGGGSTHDVAGELLPSRLHYSRHSNNAATLARARKHVGVSRVPTVKARLEKLVAAINTLSLDESTYDEVVILLGGEPPEVARGERAPPAGSSLAGDWGNPENLHDAKKAFAALGSMLAQSVGAYGRLDLGDDGAFELSALVGSTFKLADGATGARLMVTPVFAALAEEARELRLSPDAPPLDILGLVRVWRASSLPELKDEARLRRFAAANPAPPAIVPVPAPPVAGAPPVAAAAAAKATATPAQRAAADIPALLARIAAPGATSATRRTAARRARALAAAAGLPDPCPASAQPQPRQPSAAAPAASTLASAQAQYAAALAAMQAAGGMPPPMPPAPPAVAALPPPPPPPPAAPQPAAAAAAAAAPLAAARPAAAATPFSAAQMQAAIVGQHGPPATRWNCVAALGRILTAAQTTGTYPCSEIHLFGVCSPRTSGGACTRCAAAPQPGRPMAVVPAGARAAIKAACTDPAVAALVLAG